MLKELTLFYADWCTPCKKKPKQYIDDFSDNYRVTKVNVDENTDLVDTFEVKALPTIILMDDGEELDRVVGSVTESQVIDKLNLEKG